MIKALKVKSTWNEVFNYAKEDVRSTALSIRKEQVPIGRIDVQAATVVNTNNGVGSHVSIQNAPDYTNFNKTFKAGMSLTDFAKKISSVCLSEYGITKVITPEILRRWNPSIPNIGDGNIYWIKIENL